jgi:hypothetical protein
MGETSENQLLHKLLSLPDQPSLLIPTQVFDPLSMDNLLLFRRVGFGGVKVLCSALLGLFSRFTWINLEAESEDPAHKLTDLLHIMSLCISSSLFTSSFPSLSSMLSFCCP